MKRIAKFHKVSLEQFMEGWKDTFGEQYTEDQIKALYEEIKCRSVQRQEVQDMISMHRMIL